MAETKRGWWSIEWNLSLDGERVRWSDLSDATQEHICELIKDGYYSGEIIEEEDENE